MCYLISRSSDIHWRSNWTINPSRLSEGDNSQAGWFNFFCLPPHTHTHYTQYGSVVTGSRTLCCTGITTRSLWCGAYLLHSADDGTLTGLVHLVRLAATTTTHFRAVYYYFYSLFFECLVFFPIHYCLNNSQKRMVKTKNYLDQRAIIYVCTGPQSLPN